MSIDRMICADCGQPMSLNVLSRWPNGDIQEAEWTCGHDDHRKARGWYCDMGTIDLGLVTDEELEDLPRDAWTGEIDLNTLDLKEIL